LRSASRCVQLALAPVPVQVRVM